MCKFRLVDKVGSKWEDFGLIMNLEHDQLTQWKEKFHCDSAKCWCAVMEHWISSGGQESDYPVTWEGLQEMLVDVQYDTVAKDLAKALSSSVAPSPHSSHFLLPASVCTSRAIVIGLLFVLSSVFFAYIFTSF